MADNDPATEGFRPPARSGSGPSVSELAGPTCAPFQAIHAAAGPLPLPGETGLAPSFPPPPHGGPAAVAPRSPEVLAPSERIDDFEILRVLGRGGFGVVYLARQLSLDRQVALKVTIWQGSEGRKMAQLEHEHIVQVFSESVDLAGVRRLLCMQYVPGPTLKAALQELQALSPADRSGAALLAVIDRLTQHPASFDPVAMRHREMLGEFDWAETVCWMGARLAEALDYAHSRGVIHRDVKPGNILLSQYGRPMLVDFNLAFQPLSGMDGSASPLGGTLAYMAPEHLDAFNEEEDVPAEVVAEAADIYSLGVVLYEMLAGRLPFFKQPAASTKGEILRELSAARRAGPEPLPAAYPRVLDQVVARCLDADPQRRFSSGRELSAALEGCRQYHAAEKAMPPLPRWLTPAARYPIAAMLVLSLAPHVLATVVNIAYNQIRIISHLSAAQETVFVWLICVYDSLAYSLGVGLALALILPPVYRAWTLADARQPADPAAIDAGRRMAVAWPRWAAGLACLGWLPGGLIFPMVLNLFAGPLPWPVGLHLVISFTLSGLIALTYSTLLVQWISLRVVYPRLWHDIASFRATPVAELRPVPRRLRFLQVLSGVIPLAGAMLITLTGPQQFTTDEYRSFRFLVMALIVLGMGGYQLALFAAGRLSQTLAALTGSRTSV